MDEPCIECGELEAHELHHPWILNNYFQPHPDACNYDASYEGEELGYVATMDCHEYEGDNQ